MAEATQVLVKFITRLPEALRVPETPIAVPASIKRLGLSQIINHLLALEPNRPFDFIINGELLRKPLEAHLLQHGLSAESLLEVEYVPAVVPPEVDKTAPHDDWVSAVSGIWGASKVVSASYDGRVRTWDVTGGSAECTGSWQAHQGAVNSVTCDPTTADQPIQLLYSAGKDQAVRMWQVTGGEQQLLANFQGHTDAVECVVVSPNGQLVASSGWDGQILTWKAGEEVAEAAREAAPPPSKRRKGAGKKDAATGAGSLDEQGVAQSPVSTLQGPGHTHCVSAVCWSSNRVLFSGGWDHAVRRWDLETGINTDTYNGSKAVCSLACSQAPDSSVVALGCSDKVLRLWDCRSRPLGEEVPVKNYPSHAGWVVGLAWSPASPHHVASASHDHTVKIWDTRSAVPLATLADHTDKALCVAWLGAEQLVSGGADCKLLKYRTSMQAIASK